MIRKTFPAIVILSFLALHWSFGPAYSADDLGGLFNLLSRQAKGSGMTTSGSTFDVNSILIQQELYLRALRSQIAQKPSGIETQYRRRLKRQNSFPDAKMPENIEYKKQESMASGGEGLEPPVTPEGEQGGGSDGARGSNYLIDPNMSISMGGGRGAQLAPGAPYGVNSFEISQDETKQAESKMKLTQKRENPRLMAEKQERLTPIAVEIIKLKEQLRGLEDAKDEKSEKVRTQLQSQLVALTTIEAEATIRRTEDLGMLEKRKIQPNKPLYLQTVRQLKPLTVPEDISQYGYEMFNVPPSAYSQLVDAPVPDDYIVGPGDEIAISLTGSLSQQMIFTVSRDGTINFLEEKPVFVSGLTVSKVSALIAKLVKEKMIGASVQVNIGKLRWVRVLMMGDVEQPGMCLVNGYSTLSSALMLCGGAKKIGSLRNVLLLRGGKKVVSLDLYDLLQKGDTSKDPHIQGGDVVMVPPIQGTIAVAGEVNRPAIYEMNNKKLSLEDILEMAGGLRPTSLYQMAQIERIDATGNVSVIDIDLGKVDKAIPLFNGDLVKIFPILETGNDGNLVFLMGNVKRPGKRAYVTGMRVADVLPSPAELLPDSYLDYGIIERESGDIRESSLVRFNVGKMFSGQVGENIELMPRDRIYVFHRDNLMVPVFVAVEGLVQHPGKYDFKKGMRAADLLLLGGGLQRDSQFLMAELYRTDPSTNTVAISHVDLNKALAMEESANVLLEESDRLVVYSAVDAGEKATVSISGEVNFPGTYPYADNATVLDLLIAGGNLTEKAYRKFAELTRYEIQNGETRTSKVIRIDIDAALAGNPAMNIQLKKGDNLFVRGLKDWDVHAKVKIGGEVLFPGEYQLMPGETLSGLISRAGGMTENAFPFGARFTRESVANLQARQFQEMAEKLEAESYRFTANTAGLGVEKAADRQQLALMSTKALVEKLRTTKPEGRMIVNISEVMRVKNSESDLRLEEGDSLYIPRVPDAVLVLGNVYNPNAFRYSKRKSTKDYLNMAGGFTENANQENSHIIKANGEVKPISMGFFRGSELGPGDVIMVPEKIERYSGLEATKDISQILYQLAITAASLKTVGLVK